MHAEQCAVIIPALNPPIHLIDYVKTLQGKGATRIVVVNDGSRAECVDVFKEISSYNGCTVLTHQTNKGKGRALKTGFAYCLEQFDDVLGVITADADGQHAAEDVGKVTDALTTHDGIVLGVRDFSEPHVPVKSYIGNRMTRYIFQLLSGQKLKDTQTGLRGISIKELPWMLKLKGERYEYEMNMLIHAIRTNVEIVEVPIQTLYFKGNSESHYRAVRDSLKILKQLLFGAAKSIHLGDHDWPGPFSRATRFTFQTTLRERALLCTFPTIKISLAPLSRYCGSLTAFMRGFCTFSSIKKRVIDTTSTTRSREGSAGIKRGPKCGLGCCRTSFQNF